MADLFPKKLIDSPRAREALEWLEESASRSLGEDMGREVSVEFVRRFYELGAVQVHAVEIDEYEDDEQNTGKIVIELPSESDARKKLFELAGHIARGQGFEAEVDNGQQYLFLMLD